MAEDSVTLQEETALRVKQLEVKFARFEADTSMTDCCLTEIDEELEEGRVSLEKLEKRVTELETDLPELFEERVATLKTENAELRIHLNLVVDAVNNITRTWNEAFSNNEQIDEVTGDDEVKVIDANGPAKEEPPHQKPDVFLPTFPFSPHPEPYWEVAIEGNYSLGNN